MNNYEDKKARLEKELEKLKKENAELSGILETEESITKLKKDIKKIKKSSSSLSKLGRSLKDTAKGTAEGLGKLKKAYGESETKKWLDKGKDKYDWDDKKETPWSFDEKPKHKKKGKGK